MNIIKVVSNSLLKQNSYIIRSNLTTILIDCGATIAELREEFKKHTGGLDLPKIDAVFLTHTHFDHIASLEELENSFNCPIYVKSGCIKNLSSSTLNASFLLAEPLTYAPKKAIEIHTEEPIKIHDITITPIFTPGHSTCSTCYLINNNLFSGDTLFYLSYGRTDLPGGNQNDLINSLNKLKKVDYLTCYPGHGIPFNKN